MFGDIWFVYVYDGIKWWLYELLFSIFYFLLDVNECLDLVFCVYGICINGYGLFVCWCY